MVVNRLRPLAPNSFKRALAARERQLGFWLSLNSLAATEIAAGIGFDWVLLDMEHSPYDLESVEQHLLAARHGGSAEFVVRIPTNDPVLVKRLLDAGVRSFMFPFVQTLEEARMAVAATRFPPDGIRGFSGSSRSSRFGMQRDYHPSAHEDICIILQVETPQAVAAIPDYCTLDGVDGMLVGPNDLAANMGFLAGTQRPEVLAKIDEARQLATAGGKAAGMLDFNTTTASKLLADGFHFLAVGGDIAAMMAGARQVLAAFET
jgi:4-hydroxy-2-oxoheptanedioate aldolase